MTHEIISVLDNRILSVVKIKIAVYYRNFVE